MASFVSGTYASYKAGTSKVLSWLYENAQKCGYGVEEEDEEEGEVEGPKKKPKPKPRGKGKKGQGSKAKGSGKAKSKKLQLATTKPKYVSVKEFTVLAETIASSEEKITVPGWVTRMIKEVIRARNKYARRFSRQSGDSTSRDFEESNAGHQHFIEVLEGVLEILSTCGSSGKEPDTTEGNDSDEDDPLAQVTNIFETLEIEADTEHTLTEPTDRPATSGPKVFYEEEPSVDETAWLIYCFFEDFNIARDYLKDLWTEYKYGDIDLTAVSLATNTAFEMFQRAEENLLKELESTLPRDLSGSFSGFKMVQGFLFNLAAIQRGQDPSRKMHPDDQYNYALFDIADWTCLPVYIILNAFLPVIQHNNAPVCKPGYFGKLNLNEDVLDPREKFIQDKIVLLERLIPELTFITNIKYDRNQSKRGVEIPGQDELTKGTLKMILTKKIPIWLILAFQVQLDIHYMLLADTSRAQAELATAATRAVDALKEYLEFSKDMYIVNWGKNNDRFLKQIMEECELWIKNDFLDPVRTAAYRNLGFDKGGTFVLLKRHPVLCGMMLFRLNVIMQDTGITLVNAWGALPTILHLYNAALMQQTLKQPWVDMEAVILANTEERVFVGGRPDNPMEYFKRFCLVMGYSAASFSTTRRGNAGVQASKRGPRQMIAPSPLAEIYHERYIGTRNQDLRSSEFTLGAIEKLLLESVGVSKPDASQQTSVHGLAEESQATLMGGDFDIKTQKQGSKDKGLAKKFVKYHRLTTLQLLKALESCIVQESFALNVDYFSLHMRSFGLLRTLAKDLDATFIKYFGPAYIERESELPFLVGYIFQVVAGSSKAADFLMPKLGAEEKGSRILIDASKVIADFIEREGHVEVDKVKKICKNFEGMELVDNRE